MEYGETLMKTCKREVMEESGWEIYNIRLLRINDNPNRPAEDRQNVDIVFVVDAIKKKSISDEEVTKLRLFSLDKLPPKEKIAFDHWEHLELYRKYLKEPFTLPVWGKLDK